jgi:hypothetical protein
LKAIPSQIDDVKKCSRPATRSALNSSAGLRIRYRRKNDDNVDPADAVSGFACATGCAAAGAGAGSSRFDERFEE